MENGVEILYEDNHVLVAYKPRGILAQADGKNLPDMLTILKNYLKEKYHKPGNVYLGLVHRLDLNTAGVMVFAKTSKAAARLSLDIKEHRFEKRYLAIVEGHISEDGSIKSFLQKDAKQLKAIISPNGQEANLDYRVIKNDYLNNSEVSYVDILLKTGRFHQIRAQFSAIGHPIFGDTKYGSKNSLSKEAFPLEAYHLGFYHPITKDWLIFEKKTII